MKKGQENFSGDLRELAWKIGGIAYLIQQQKFDEIPPLGIEEIHYGVGLLLRELSEKVKQIADAIE